jgi:hypothetical protein
METLQGAGARNSDGSAHNVLPKATDLRGWINDGVIPGFRSL